MNAHTVTIENEEFYSLMQSYRHAPDDRQMTVVARYDAVIAYIDARLAAHAVNTALRDTFAGLAMQALIKNPDAKDSTAEALTILAYEYADCMIKTRST